jgi:hypothetical protein
MPYKQGYKKPMKTAMALSRKQAGKNARPAAMKMTPLRKKRK